MPTYSDSASAVRMRKWRAANPAKAAASLERWKAANPTKAMEYQRKSRLKYAYRITKKQRSGMLVSQDGLCAICWSEPATQIDHDHKTGRVRGMLCSHCNRGLGSFRDNPEALRFAADYLEGEYDARRTDVFL